MAKEPSVRLTKFELEVMEALWALGSGSVRELQERLPAAKRPAYTTVQTIVYRLEEKGAVRRVKKVGNAHVFEPAVTRRAAVRRLLDDLLELFGGSPRALVAQLVETGRLSLEDVREVESTLAQLAAEGEAKGAAAETSQPTAGKSEAARTSARRERSRR